MSEFNEGQKSFLSYSQNLDRELQNSAQKVANALRKVYLSVEREFPSGVYSKDVTDTNFVIGDLVVLARASTNSEHVSFRIDTHEMSPPPGVILSSDEISEEELLRLLGRYHSATFEKRHKDALARKEFEARSTEYWAKEEAKNRKEARVKATGDFLDDFFRGAWLLYLIGVVAVWALFDAIF